MTVRRKLTALTGHTSVLYLNATDKLMAMRTGTAEEERARAEYRLGDLQWCLDRPRELLLSSEFCAADDSMDFMLSQCLQSLDEVLELVQQVKYGRIDFDMETSRLVSGRSETWEMHARDFWTVIVHEICSHLEGEDASRAHIMAALHKPVPSSKRSWPSKQAFLELKAYWEKLSPEARTDMTLLSSDEFWFVQACDIAIASSVVLSFKQKGLTIDAQGLLKQLRRQCKLTSSLETQFDPLPKISINAVFAAEPGCLDEIYKRAVWHSDEKSAILMMALFSRFEELCRGNGFLVADPTCTWADMDRLVATLILEALLHRHSMVMRASEFLRKELADERMRAEATALRKQQRRQEKRKAVQAQKVAGTAAMLLAEKERQLAEQERQLAEQERRAAERLRAESEAMREVQEEMRVQMEVQRRLCEERRLWERQQEKLRIQRLLAVSPTWDASCLQVSNTFLSFLPPSQPFSKHHEW